MGIAVMVHGDGQFAPELIRSMVVSLVGNHADAVFGSQTGTSGGARRGGVSVYKRVRNCVLTRVQNFCAGLRLSEWQSGYRAYNLHRLDTDSVGRMSNAFIFDVEMILNSARHGRRILEVPIPTLSGEENRNATGVCRAVDLVAESVRFRVRRGRTAAATENAA